MQMPTKTLLLLLSATSSLSLAFAQQTPAINSVDLALKKPFISSDLNKSGWDKGLTDGSWRPDKGLTFATGNSITFPKTVTVDLEAPTPVGYVATGVPGFGSTKTVTVALSTDGTAFTDVGTYVFSVNKEEKHLFSFPAATARYVRLTYGDHYEESVGYPNVHAFTTEVAVYAQGEAPVLSPIVPPEKADVAAPKYGDGDEVQPLFRSMHESFLKRGKEGPIGVLFLGDSITAHWAQAPDVWKQHYSAYQPANFGIGGDRTQHVLWRIDHGELDGIAPKVVVLLIGTNNIGNSAEEITRGDKKIIEEIHQKLPQTKLLLLGIFPRAAEATSPMRAKIKQVNAELSKLDDGNNTRFLDIGDKFLDADGSLPKDIMPDSLHPNVKGYGIWADAMQPLLDEMMK